MEERIEKFIEKHRLMTLATASENVPYCCSIFYAFDMVRKNFLFMSSPETKHICQALVQPTVAGTIHSADGNLLKIQGIQFTGRFYKPEGIELAELKDIYLKKFPFARLMESTLWVTEPDLIKMTDNTLGFAKKILWHRFETVS